MKSLHRSDWVKLGLLVFWIVFIGCFYTVIHFSGFPLRRIPIELRHWMRDLGPLGPFLILVLYALQTLIPSPTALLGAASGSVYGPWWGSGLVFLGLTLSAVISFGLGRFFGSHFVAFHSSGWLKKYDQLLFEEGFKTVLLMRLFLFPFDIVGIGCGMSRMLFSEYLIATLIGMAPGAVTFVVLGRAFTDPRGWAFFGVLFACSVTLAFFVQRSRWGKRLEAKKDALHESSHGG